MHLHPKSSAIAGVLALSLILCSCGGVSSSGGTGGGMGAPGGSGGAGGGAGGGQTDDACKAMGTGVGGSLNGFLPFTSANLWNTDVSSFSS